MIGPDQRITQRLAKASEPYNPMPQHILFNGQPRKTSTFQLLTSVFAHVLRSPVEIALKR
jgi:hypothetical protein